MAERIGLFGGSFDPIHIGHLVLAREAREQLELDRVIFIPAAISPHKLHREPAPAEARLEMVCAAIAGEPGFEADDCELTREGPSYTVDTARLMRARWPGAELFYFIGEDNLAKLDTWREIETLRELVHFVVLSAARSEATCACVARSMSRAPRFGIALRAGCPSDICSRKTHAK